MGYGECGGDRDRLHAKSRVYFSTLRRVANAFAESEFLMSATNAMASNNLSNNKAEQTIPDETPDEQINGSAAVTFFGVSATPEAADLYAP